jgi:hypothetical protein
VIATVVEVMLALAVWTEINVASASFGLAGKNGFNSLPVSLWNGVFTGTHVLWPMLPEHIGKMQGHRSADVIVENKVEQPRLDVAPFSFTDFSNV